jgi:hypothetical protein
MTTKKPCPGCGEVHPTRPANKVCRDCESLLKRAAEMEKQLSKIPKDETIVSFSKTYHWNQYLYTHIQGDSKSSDLMQAFTRLALAAVIRPAIKGESEFMLLG